jgi:hydrogenase nickel incorporation protein HypA/HybF
MHELSIAMNIIDIATRRAESSSAIEVREVELDIGMLSGIEIESLETALKMAARNTVLEQARFRISLLEPLAECLVCRCTFVPESTYGTCPGCGATVTRLLKGRELYIKSLLIEQEE